MLEFGHVSFSYGRAEVLRDISFSLAPGKCTALLGANASGKSTLLRLAAGLVAPQTGTITLHGAGAQNIAALSSQERAQRIALFPQWRQVPDITVRQLVAHGRYPHLGRRHILRERDREIVETALRSTGALSFAERRLPTLSGGQKQKAALAMTLAQDTPLILLDEPTAFLDISVQISLMHTLKDLTDAGKTVMLIAHDLPLALHFADACLVLHAQELLFQGEPAQAVASGAIQTAFGVRLDENFSIKDYQQEQT
ncbi:MAG: ABC transporter ATP-binding protein [Oscillospiraceae bacterium]|jgi:iron complex transport system ATP-binding protein|nr:ABC transporter ATP-binding protein [Oscillospiraceae bacterium]